MGKGSAKSDLEMQLYQARSLPGPASYSLPDKVVPSSGGKISSSKIKSCIQLEVERGAAIPGPGTYAVKVPEPKVKGGQIYRQLHDDFDFDEDDLYEDDNADVDVDYHDYGDGGDGGAR